MISLPGKGGKMHKPQNIRFNAVFSLVCMMVLVVGMIGCAPKTAPDSTSPQQPRASLSPQSSVLPSPTQKVYKARFSTWTYNTDLRTEYSQKFLDLVRQATNGSLDLTMFSASALYAMNDTPPAVAKSAVEAGFFAGGTLNAYDPRYTLENLWFIVTPQSLFKIWFGTPEGEQVIRAIEDRLNCKVVSSMPLGATYLMSTVPIRKVEDFKGLTGRYLSNADIPYYKALGMKYISVTAEEAYNSLQSGMVQVILSTPRYYKDGRWWDFVKYIVMPPLRGPSGLVVFNRDFFNSLPKDIQDKVLSVGKQNSDSAFQGIMGAGNTIIDQGIKEHGASIITWPQAEVEKMVKLFDTSGAYDEGRKGMGSDLWKAAIKETGWQLK